MKKIINETKDKISLSIIVPIYNFEKYVSQCIESILQQNYQDFELLLINDGSTDKSGNICENYLSDKRVKYINKKNGGVSSARNVGIRQAIGKYIMFVDADDFIEKNMIEEMMKELKDDQITICGYNEKFVNNTIPIMTQKKIVLTNHKEIIDSLFKYRAVSGFLWNKIYNTNIIKEFNIQFDEEISYCEDLLFNVEYLLNIKKVTILPKSLYNYRMRRSGVTWEKEKQKLNTIINSLNKIEMLLKEKNIESMEFLYNKLNVNYRLGNKEDKKIFQDYKKVLKTKKISFKRKIKLFITKNLNVIYKIYMKNKTTKNQLFE